MAFLRKFWIQSIFFLLLILFFISRLYSILQLPIFTDEAIYIRWGQIAKDDASWRFISLTDGKQPLFIWIEIFTLHFFSDPLLAGRIISVFAGVLSMVGLFFLTYELFRNRFIGLLSSFLYLIFPFALVYDRMALYDSLVGTFAVWSFFVSILLVRYIRLDIGLILGMILGGGLLTKTSATASIYLLPTTLFLFDWSKKTLRSRLIKWFFLALLAVILSFLFYSILRLSPFFYIIAEKNTLFFYPFKEWIKHPFEFFVSNWNGLWDWVTRYLTYPFLIMSFSSFFICRQYLREKILLMVWFVLPFIGLALIGRTLYPRFIFFMTLSLLPLTSFAIYHFLSLFKKKILIVIITLLIFIIPLQVDYFVLADFAHAPIPYSDISQYNNDWPSGTGIRESIEFFLQQAKDKKIFVGTEGTFGLMPYAYELYLLPNKNILIKGYWPIGNRPPNDVLQASKKMPTYFVFYQPCFPCAGKGLAPVSWNETQVLQIQKASGNTYLTVYQIKPE